MTGAAPRLRVRQVGEADRWLLWGWRNAEPVRRMSVDDAPIPESVHSAWFDQAYPGMRDRTLIVEWDGEPVGWYRIEDWDDAAFSGRWGLGTGSRRAPIGLGGALTLLPLGHAFGRLGATSMTGQVLEANTNMTGILRRLGIPVDPDVQRVPRADGSQQRLLAYTVVRGDWPMIRERGLAMLPIATRTEVDGALARPPEPNGHG